MCYICEAYSKSHSHCRCGDLFSGNLYNAFQFHSVTISARFTQTKMTKLLIDFRRPKKKKKKKKNPRHYTHFISACVRTKCNLSIKKKKKASRLKGPGLMNRPQERRKKSQDIISYTYIVYGLGALIFFFFLRLQYIRGTIHYFIQNRLA